MGEFLALGVFKAGVVLNTSTGDGASGGGLRPDPYEAPTTPRSKETRGDVGGGGSPPETQDSIRKPKTLIFNTKVLGYKVIKTPRRVSRGF
jgi:hypothetical protein